MVERIARSHLTALLAAVLFLLTLANAWHDFTINYPSASRRLLDGWTSLGDVWTGIVASASGIPVARVLLGLVPAGIALACLLSSLYFGRDGLLANSFLVELFDFGGFVFFLLLTILFLQSAIGVWSG